MIRKYLYTNHYEKQYLNSTSGEQRFIKTIDNLCTDEDYRPFACHFVSIFNRDYRLLSLTPLIPFLSIEPMIESICDQEKENLFYLCFDKIVESNSSQEYIKLMCEALTESIWTSLTMHQALDFYREGTYHDQDTSSFIKGFSFDKLNEFEQILIQKDKNIAKWLEGLNKYAKKHFCKKNQSISEDIEENQRVQKYPIKIKTGNQLIDEIFSQIIFDGEINALDLTKALQYNIKDAIKFFIQNPDDDIYKYKNLHILNSAQIEELYEDIESTKN